MIMSNPLVRYTTPNAIDGNLAREYNREMELSPKGSYMCFTDRDVWFPNSDYAKQIHEIISIYGEAFYTCVTPRINCKWQKIDFVGTDDALVEYSKNYAIGKETTVENQTHSQLWSGMVMVVPKDKWIPLNESSKSILGLDNLIHKMAIIQGCDVLLMKGVICYHYYSGYDGPAGTGNKSRDKSHLK